MRRKEERQRLEAEKHLAAALDAVIAMLPIDERKYSDAEAEPRVRQRMSDKLRTIGPIYRLLIQIEMRPLVRQRYADRVYELKAQA